MITLNIAVAEMVEEIFGKKGNIIAKIIAVLYIVFILITCIGFISAMVVSIGKHQKPDANVIFTLIMFALSQIFALFTIILYRTKIADTI